MRGISVTIVLTILCLLTNGLHATEPCSHSNWVRECRITSEHRSIKPLESISANLTKDENVSISIEIPFLSLTKNISFNDLQSVTINGDHNSAVIINCTHSTVNSGITFKSVKSITLTRLRLRYCGSLVIMKNRNYSSALTLRYCKTVEIRYSIIEKSRGIGLTILNHRNGTINIFESNFTRNKIPHEFKKDKIYGGGGVYVYSGFNWNSSLSISIKFERCHFSRNVAYTRVYRSFYTDEFGEDRSGYGRGGGVYLAFEKNTITRSCVHVWFLHCMFKRNQAFLGGGLSVSIGGGRNHRINANITTIVEHSVFDSNGCDKYTARIGGGVHLSYNLHFTSASMVYKLQNVKFIRNRAELGGGIFFFSNIWTNPNKHLLIFETCRFEYNRAHTGSAIDMNPTALLDMLLDILQ